MKLTIVNSRWFQPLVLLDHLEFQNIDVSSRYRPARWWLTENRTYNVCCWSEMVTCKLWAMIRSARAHCERDQLMHKTSFWWPYIRVSSPTRVHKTFALHASTRTYCLQTNTRNGADSVENPDEKVLQRNVRRKVPLVGPHGGRRTQSSPKCIYYGEQDGPFVA
jgi:hypothetical protein